MLPLRKLGYQDHACCYKQQEQNLHEREAFPHPCVDEQKMHEDMDSVSENFSYIQSGSPLQVPPPHFLHSYHPYFQFEKLLYEIAYPACPAGFFRNNYQSSCHFVSASHYTAPKLHQIIRDKLLQSLHGKTAHCKYFVPHPHFSH